MRDYGRKLDALRERIAGHRENQRMLEQLRQQEQQCRQLLEGKLGGVQQAMDALRQERVKVVLDAWAGCCRP